jgi:hypothetical protein
MGGTSSTEYEQAGLIVSNTRYAGLGSSYELDGVTYTYTHFDERECMHIECKSEGKPTQYASSIFTHGLRLQIMLMLERAKK